MRHAATLALAACAPFGSEVPHTQGEDLCADRAAFAEHLQGCLERGCAGVASYRGTAEEVPFVVGDWLWDAVVTVEQVGAFEVIDVIELYGVNPTFEHVLGLTSVGLARVPGAERDLALDFGADHLPGALRDDRVTLDLRMSTPGRSLHREARPDSGGVTARIADEGWIELQFSGALAGEPLRGCAVVVTPEVHAL